MKNVFRFSLVAEVIKILLEHLKKVHLDLVKCPECGKTMKSCICLFEVKSQDSIYNLRLLWKPFNKDHTSRLFVAEGTLELY